MDEPLRAFLDALHAADDGKTCFIVEGKRDVAALGEQGIRHVRELDNNLYLFAERVAGSFGKAVVLTDGDAAGKQLYGKLRGYLIRNGVKVNDAPRELLFLTGLRQVEGLGTYRCNH
ncbi:hypothetical protein GF367_01640 [Candidatus Woesearchaeota archaeon]|nr:hypothetical protein [Candidatus Woesearchaeota archaeon]